MRPYDENRFDNDGMVWKLESFEATGFLDRVYDIMRTEAKNRNHTFIKDYPQNLPMLTGDKEKLQQVLINILSNAMKYTESGGKISMEAHEEQNGVVVYVSDNGIGVPKEDIPRLFERFYCVEKARSSESGGTGLGLAIAKEIIDAHGGKIAIESEVGAGTRVCILFPYETLLKNE